MTSRAAARPQRRIPDTHAILDALPVLVIGVDAAGRIGFANATAAETLAAATGGLVGRRLAEIFGADNVISAVARRASNEGVRLTQPDITLEGPAFSIGRADLIASPLDDSAGAVLTFIVRQGLRSDIGPRPTPPVVRALAHEVRNPLAGIRAAAQLIGKDGDAETRILTDMICAESDRIRRLTDRLDALDGIAPPHFASVNLHEALGRAKAVIAAAFSEVALTESYDPSLPNIEGDMDQLIQVFLNIAKNAAEAVRGQKGGAVLFATRYRPGVRMRSSGGSTRPQLEATITDNGPGLPAAIAGRLFEPFATTKTGGVGLGLPIAAEIVARHEGRIEVESRPGRTMFRIILPITEPESA
jgi:two-component system nitrogen regulation sensor histidine kinase GlnL